MVRSGIAATALCAVFACTTPSFAADKFPDGIGGKQLGNGWQFADAKGMTLYTFDRDEGAPGKSTCNKDCAVTWPPLLVAEGASPQPNWSFIKREDGATQWAYKGKPLYTYAQDAFPGATFGDGVGTVWRVAFEPIPTPGEVRITQTILGQVLADAKGLTLYSYSADKPGQKPGCVDACLKTWVPIVAPAVANNFGDWSVIVRDTGLRQWAFKGVGVYRHVADVAMGEISGNGIKGWQVVVLEPVPPLPPWATIQASDAGELIANEKGLTVYAREFNPRNRRLMATQKPGCNGECYDPEWIPFVAAADAKAFGSWALVEMPDGKKQWSYKGQKLFTNIKDTKPGDFKGIRFGGDRSWNAIMRSGQPMQGVTVGG